MFNRCATTLTGAIIGFTYAKKLEQEANVKKNLAKLSRTFGDDYVWLSKYDEAKVWSGWESLNVGIDLAEGMNGKDDYRQRRVLNVRRKTIKLLNSLDVFWFKPFWNDILSDRREINDICFRYAFMLFVVEAYYWQNDAAEISHKLYEILDVYNKTCENEFQCRKLERFFQQRKNSVPYQLKHVFDLIKPSE